MIVPCLRVRSHEPRPGGLTTTRFVPGDDLEMHAGNTISKADAGWPIGPAPDLQGSFRLFINYKENVY